MADCEIPLKQLEVDGEPKVKPSGKFAAFHKFPGLFLNKTKLIILAVLLLILLIIIIVLAAVLGHEQAKDRRAITRKKHCFIIVLKCYSHIKSWGVEQFVISLVKVRPDFHVTVHCHLNKEILTSDKFEQSSAVWYLLYTDVINIVISIRRRYS